MGGQVSVDSIFGQGTTFIIEVTSKVRVDKLEAEVGPEFNYATKVEEEEEKS